MCKKPPDHHFGGVRFHCRLRAAFWHWSMEIVISRQPARSRTGPAHLSKIEASCGHVHHIVSCANLQRQSCCSVEVIESLISGAQSLCCRKTTFSSFISGQRAKPYDRQISGMMCRIRVQLLTELTNSQVDCSSVAPSSASPDVLWSDQGSNEEACQSENMQGVLTWERPMHFNVSGALDTFRVGIVPRSLWISGSWPSGAGLSRWRPR